MVDSALAVESALVLGLGALQAVLLRRHLRGQVLFLLSDSVDVSVHDAVLWQMLHRL